MSERKELEILPEIKQIVGALLFAAGEPLPVKRIRKVMIETGNGFGGPYEQYAKVTPDQIESAVEELRDDLEKARTGLSLVRVAGGWRLQNDPACGPFVRVLLDKNRSLRLSKPALETLAVIAYRQPCLRSEIEEVRGVSVDGVLRKLIDMQLVRAVRRSDLPGRPWLFGTTRKFLEHFGLNSLDDLPAADELRRTLSARAPNRPETPTLPGMEKQANRNPTDSRNESAGDTPEKTTEKP